MKKLMVAAVAVLLLAQPVMATDTEGRVGVGFTDIDLPVGGRMWVTDMIGIDAGVMLNKIDTPSSTRWGIGAGVPIRLIDRDRANLNVRPAFAYMDMDGPSTLDFMLELEGEVFLTDDFSLRASHGVMAHRVDPGGGGSSTTDFMTYGGNLTSVGFFFYFK